MVYKWAEGSRINLPVEVVGREINRVQKRHGGTVSRAQLVEQCRPPGNPLHGQFTWDDRLAGIERRLDQAGYLLRSVVMVRAEQPDAQPVRAFVSVSILVDPDEKQSMVYTSFERAMSDPDLKEQVLSQALSDWHSFKRKYGAIEVLANGIAAMNRAVGLASMGTRKAG